MPTLSLRPESDVAAGRFWRRPLVQDTMPLLVSVMIHLAIIALGLLTYKAIAQVVSVSVEPVLIPSEVNLLNEPMTPLQVFAGPNDDATRKFMRDDVPDVAGANGFGTQTSLINAMQTGGGAGSSADDAIAIGPGDKFGRGKGNGLGVGPGTGAGGDAGLAPFGPPGGGSRTFTPPRGNINRIVYLCDSSGSMMMNFDTLRGELRKAIETLRPIQQFDVLFFAADGHIALDAQLLHAVPENKRKAYDFMEGVAARGSSDPIPGLRAAFATAPQLIYILTDGDFPNNEHVLVEIRKLNAAKKVRINTIAYMQRGETYEKFLQTIADENGGVFKFVGDAELRK